MATKGFRVIPEDLVQVANQVRQLHDDLSGGSGYVSGNLTEYQKVDQSVLADALTPFWAAKGDVYANAYGYEHQGIVDTMKSMLTQLQSLEAACRNTAAQYSKQDANSKQAVQQSDPGAPGGPGGPGWTPSGGQ